MGHSANSNAPVTPALISASRQGRAGGHGSVWLALRDPDEILEQGRVLDAMDEETRARQPLFGLSFGVKDNIDVAGLPTTAGCPAYSYVPSESAPVVALLEAAGAVCLGKTHLDQFATGLVGTRSPHGPLPNPFNASYVSGGSSSGSAVAVALGHVAFALGTDTAGSGRVPAGFNNVLGLKPSRGLISTRGVVPACRSLDCVSIFAADLSIAWATMRVTAQFDPGDPYARAITQRSPFPGTDGARPLRLGVPRPLEFFGDRQSEAHFARVQAEWLAVGADVPGVPFAPFAEIGDLLYDGPWVAERAAAIGRFIAAHPQECLPTIRTIVAGADQYSATDAFRAFHDLRSLATTIAPIWNEIDALLVPTAPTFPTIASVSTDPFGINASLGRYTNFVNLLDLAAIAVPAGFRADGLPAGFTLIAPAGSDHALAELARRYLATYPMSLGAMGRVAPPASPLEPLDDGRPTIRIAVAGAHMRGMPLNHELVDLQARFAGAARTAPRYRLHALAGSMPKPGLVRAKTGAAIGVELWDVPVDRFGVFVAGVPPPLAIGNVELADGVWVKGFVCEPVALQDATDITAHGDWRSYLEAQRQFAGRESAAMT